MQLVEIVQYMCIIGEMRQELGWTILIFIPRGNTDTQGIRLMEMLWNFVEALIDAHLRSIIRFHDVLHGFCA